MDLKTLLMMVSVAAMKVDTSKHVGLEQLEEALSDYMKTSEGRNSVDRILQDKAAKEAFNSISEDKELRVEVDKILNNPKVQAVIKQSKGSNDILNMFINLLKHRSAMRSGILLAANPELREDILHLIEGDLAKKESQDLFADGNTLKLIKELKKDPSLFELIKDPTKPNQVHDTFKFDNSFSESALY